MPDIIVHASMGRRVLDRLELGLDQDLFILGCYGPDPFLFYHFISGRFKNKINRLGKTMHEERTGDFLIELAKASTDISYVAGFLCHYALDSTVHPLVNRYVTDDKRYLHMAIEHKLEIIDGGDFIWPDYLDKETEKMVAQIIEKVYGFPQPMKEFRRGYRDLKLFSRIVADKKQILCRLFRHGKLGALSYHTKLTDEFDLSEFDELLEQSIEHAVKYINGVAEFKNNQISENELMKIIGNRPCSGMMACPVS